MKSSRAGPSSRTCLNFRCDEGDPGDGLEVVARHRAAPNERWILATLHREAILESLSCNHRYWDHETETWGAWPLAVTRAEIERKPGTRDYSAPTHLMMTNLQTTLTRDSLSLNCTDYELAFKTRRRYPVEGDQGQGVARV